MQLVILPGRQTDFHHQTAASVDDALEAIRIFWPSGSCRKARDVCLVPPRRPRHVSLPDQQDRPRPAWCVHIFAFALTIDHRPWTIDHGPWTMDHGPSVSLSRTLHSSSLSPPSSSLARSPGVGAHLEFLYDAFAVVCHRGSCSGGHYVSYVRREDRWFLADDALITEVPSTVVENCMAYMVFYRLRHRACEV